MSHVELRLLDLDNPFLVLYCIHLRYSIWQAVYSYLDRLLSRVICGNLVTTNENLVQNVVQTCQFLHTIEYNQPAQNNNIPPKIKKV